MFDPIAKRYDKINRILSFGMDRNWRKRAACYLPKKKDLYLLDLAVGTGDQLIACFESKASIKVAVGMDLSSQMLTIGKEKLDKKPYKDRIQWSLGSGEKLPYLNHFFDVATSSFGIRNISNPLIALQELYRVLKNNGRLIILEFSLPCYPIRLFHHVYLRYLLPFIGGLLSKNKKAYIYLSQTIEKFPYGKQFCSLMEQAGFQNIQAIPLALGAVTIYIGEKNENLLEK